ncbi:MAG TPA: polysaccharide biosynthesis C-terminal domain-containing protein [Flavipsychrobacter sp.]|nr:polysaccharide biosynthesis C-terminal domain-containing protein [Flavipsychrobacter sp.]
MGIVFRQSIKTTIVIFTGAALGALIAWWYPRIINQQQLGLINNTINIGALAQLIVLLGTGTTMQVFIQKYVNTDERRSVLITVSLLVPLLSTIVFTIPYLIFKSYIIHKYQPTDQPYMDTYYLYIPVMIIIWSYMTLFDMYLQTQLKVAVSSFVREIVLRICNVALMVLFVFKIISFYQLVAGSLLVFAIPALILLIISLQTKGFRISFNWKVFSKGEYKEIIHFSWYHLLLGITIPLMASLSSLMLATDDKMASLAVYSRALFIISLVNIPYRSMSYATWPILNKAYINNEQEELKNLFHRSSINILIVSVAMFVIVISNLNNAVAVFPKGYEAIKPLVMILLIGALIDSSTGLNNELLSISKYYKFSFRLSVLLIIMLYFFNHFLIHRYSFYGAAWASTIALAIFNILKMFFLWKKLDIQPFTSKSSLVIIAGVVTVIIGYYIPYMIHPVIDAILRTIIIVVCYGILLLLLKPSPDLNQYLQTVRAKKRLF